MLRPSNLTPVLSYNLLLYMQQKVARHGFV